MNTSADTPAPGAPPREAPSARDVLRMLRPTQWTKNAVVAAAFFFAYWDHSRPEPLTLADLWRVIPAVILFSLVSSSVYILNDLRDRDADRVHPSKRHRPIASGRIAPSQALLASGLLMAIGVAGSLCLSPRFALAVGLYILLQLAYSFGLKHLAVVDSVMIATGFVLRAVAGAWVFPNVTISGWLLLCTFLLALFLALCKRRHEKVSVAIETSDQRPALSGYSLRALDLMIVATATATVFSYAFYALWPTTVAKFGTRGLLFTVPIVLAGLLRYVALVYRHEKGERPERILLTDVPLLLLLLAYGLAVALILQVRP